MDEPFSSLDYLARVRKRQELACTLQERPRTVVLVRGETDAVISHSLVIDSMP